MSDEDEPERGGQKRFSRASIEAAASVVGAVVGEGTGIPGAGIVGAAAPPYVLALLDTFGSRWSERRRENAAQMLLSAADEMGSESVEDVLNAAADSPAKEFLTGAAINAAASTAMQGKIRALGVVLARALESHDDAVVDESGLLIAALADLEAPHVRLLLHMARPSYGADFPPGDGQGWDMLGRYGRPFSRQSLAGNFPQYGIALDGVLATLERHGLIAETPLDMAKALKDRDRQERQGWATPQVRNPARQWKLTALGTATLRALYEAGEEVLTDRGGADSPPSGGES